MTTEPGPPAGAVLLAAGSGSRLAALTGATHKSLLPVAGRAALARAIDACRFHGVADIVVVTGDKAAEVERFLEEEVGGVRTAHNPRFAEDTNILSAQIGVEALEHPELGYLVIETDLVLERLGWAQVLRPEPDGRSFWVTHDEYREDLTGGALDVDAGGRVREIVYAPDFDRTFAGWRKLLGILYVGPAETAVDRALRRRAAERTTAQYYMMPWVENLELLPCRARVLSDVFAATYNDLEHYRTADRRLTEIERRSDGAPSVPGSSEPT